MNLDLLLLDQILTQTTQITTHSTENLMMVAPFGSPCRSKDPRFLQGCFEGRINQSAMARNLTPMCFSVVALHGLLANFRLAMFEFDAHWISKQNPWMDATEVRREARESEDEYFRDLLYRIDAGRGAFRNRQIFARSGMVGCLVANCGPIGRDSEAHQEITTIGLYGRLEARVIQTGWPGYQATAVEICRPGGSLIAPPDSPSLRDSTPIPEREEVLRARR